MIQNLFVYGTLAPGRPNEHILAPLDGTWQPAAVNGHLQQIGWGAALGYPGLVLDEEGDEVRGFVFSAAGLAPFWSDLDDFEGDQYERVLTTARLDDGSTVEAYIYVLAEEVRG